MPYISFVVNVTPPVYWFCDSPFFHSEKDENMWRQALKPFAYGIFRFVVIILYGHTAATNMHELTGDFYTVGEILGHTLKGIGMSLGISTNLEAVTARYVDVRLERKRTVLKTYHKALQPPKAETKKPAKKKSNVIEMF